MTSRQTFPRTHRLGGLGTFAKIRTDGQRIILHPLIAFSVSNDLGFDRLGISIGRSIGDSVTRNRIKRALRESFRKREKLRPGRDIVVQLRRHDLLENEQYRGVMDDLIRRVQELSR